MISRKRKHLPVWIPVCMVAVLGTVLSPALHANTLEELIAETLISHPAIRSSQADVRAAQEAVDSARWQFFPTPSVTAESVSTSNSDVAFEGDDLVTTLRLTQPLWTGGRLRAGLAGAKAREDVSQAGLQGQQQDLALRVVQAYGEWMGTHLQQQAWAASVATHERLYEQVRRRAGEGASSDADLLLAQGRLESTRADLAASTAGARSALARLSQLVGRPVDGNALAGNRSSKRDLSLPVSELVLSAERVNPALRRAQADASVAESEIDSRKADRWPEIFARVEHQRGDFLTRDADDETRFYVGLTSRFGAGLSTFSNIRQERWRRDAALAEVESQRRNIQEQVTSDFALLSSFDARVAALTSSLSTAEKVSESYGRQFLAGRKSWLDVMNAARDEVGVAVLLADSQAAQLALSWRLAIFSEGVSAAVPGVPAG